MKGHIMFSFFVVFFKIKHFLFQRKQHLLPTCNGANIKAHVKLNFLEAVPAGVAVESKVCPFQLRITDFFMSQNEYLNRLVQIIYDTTILNTSDMFPLQQPNSQESQSLMLFPINTVQFH